MTLHHKTDLALAELCPPEATYFFSAKLPIKASLTQAEQSCTTGMVAKRRAEFTHGRFCARSAMTLLGVDSGSIGKGPNREPIWPSGIVGSISHTGAAAAAIVSRSSRHASIGLDMEIAEPLQADLIPMILRPEENLASDGTRAKLIFSIKESIYKCLYPLTQAYIDFLDMEVYVNEDTQSFTAHSHTVNCPAELAHNLTGRYSIGHHLVMSSAWIATA